MDRLEFIRLMTAAAVGAALGMPEYAEAVKTVEHPSPKRAKRPRRKGTDFIILHTTEAPGESSLLTLTEGGKANYMVDTDGKAYSIMGQNLVSIGCGRSMWNRKSNLDSWAINIEVVGRHNRPCTQPQYSSLRSLVEDLQRAYGLEDENVMPHSQVAYGRPNKWHRRSHRGRKRCGMLFATPSVREKLGLSKRKALDPDVRAGRLVVADPYLFKMLYGKAPRAEAPPVAEEYDEDRHVLRTIGKGETAWRYAGDEFDDPTTVYVLTDGRVRTGSELKALDFGFSKMQPGTQVAVGYVYGGHVHPGRSAYSIVGSDWNDPSTLYRFPDSRLMTGDDVDPDKIPDGTLILFRD